MTEDRARFTDEEIQEVLAHYQIGMVEHQQDFPRGSHLAAKHLIWTDRGRFILKRRPPEKSDPYRIAFAHELQTYLADQSFPLAHLIGTTRRNNSMLKHNGSIYELYEFIPGEAYNSMPEAAGEAGKILAVFHRLVGRMTSEYEPPASYYHDSPRVRELLGIIADRLADSPGSPSARGRAEEVSDVTTRLRALYETAVDEANSRGVDDWETQIVHGDWHPGNLLFSEHHVVAVLDFDSARIQPPVTDLANGALQFSMTTGDRSLESWPDACDIPRFRAFVAGYDSVQTITLFELDCLAPLMIEALIAEAVGPIAADGSFARLDGFAFLQTVARKAQWLRNNGAELVSVFAL